MGTGAGFLILDRGPHFVQFAFGGDGRIACEIVSDEFLEGEARLLPGMLERLVAQGWRAPAEDCDLSYCTLDHPNIWTFLDPPIDFAQLARETRAVVQQTFLAPIERFTLCVEVMTQIQWSVDETTHPVDDRA